MTAKIPERNPQLGLQLRDAGCDQVLENAGEIWREDARFALKHFCRHRIASEFSLEDFRAWWQTQGGYEPHHPNAWSALALWAIRGHLIEPTGRWERAKRSTAHARKIFFYRPCGQGV